MNDNLIRLAELIKARNANELEITQLIARPAALGHIGEYLASSIFHITLEKSASRKGIDGHFSDGSLNGSSVNIKWYAMRDGLIDVTPDFLPHYYLVLTGPRPLSMTSRGRARAWSIDSVYLFDARSLVDQLRQRSVKVGVACSVSNPLWEQAEVFPNQRSGALILSSEQREELTLFRSSLSDR